MPETSEPADRPTGRACFSSGVRLAAAPVVLLLLPLFWHRSDHPIVAGFSRPYALFLTLAILAAVALVLAVGWACRHARTRTPAVAFVVILVAVVAALAATEVLLTVRLRSIDPFSEYAAWGHKRSLLFGFEAAPNNRWANAGATYSTDRAGFRTHGRGPWEGATGTRIFTLGESSVFGYGLNDDETWPHLLEEKLRTRVGEDGLVVVNAGNNGFTSVQTLFRFYTKVLPLRPTHVVLYLGPNDIYATGPDHLMITENILFTASLTDYWAAETRGKNLYSRSLVFYILQRAVPALAPRKTRAAEAVATTGQIWGQKEADEIGARYIENVRTICMLARSHGVTPVIATFMHDLPAGVPFPPLALRTTNALLRSFADEQGILLVDLAEALRSVPEKAPYFSADRYHPSRQGAELIAATIAAAWR